MNRDAGECEITKMELVRSGLKSSTFGFGGTGAVPAAPRRGTNVTKSPRGSTFKPPAAARSRRNFRPPCSKVAHPFFYEHLFMGLLGRLSKLEAAGHPIRVAVIGVGQMGRAIVRQVARLPGMRVVGLCDVVIDRAVTAATQTTGVAEVAESEESLRKLAAEDRTVITAQADWLTKLPQVDALVEATGDPEAGARLGFVAITAAKPLVSLNVEADVTVGPLLAWLARRAGTLYTVAGGDEPSVLCEMVDFARGVGLEVVCAGKGKNNRLDRRATPQTVEAEAAAHGMSARMLASFVDGTKTMVEMAALANATGLVPDIPGLHGPAANVADLLQIFVPEVDGGVLHERGVVDYAVGDVAPGVFVTAAAPNAAIRRDLDYLKMGEGPYYLLYRPYHLASLEAPLSLARAVLDHEVTMAALGPPRAECIAAAKRDLATGEVLDGIGGGTVYGLAVPAEWAAAKGGVPIGVVGGARMRRAVARGTTLTDGDVVLDEGASIVHLRRLQDALVRQDILR